MPWTYNYPGGTVVGDIPHTSGRFYDSRISSGAYTTLALVANTLYGVPFEVPKNLTYATINIAVTTLAAASSIRLGIYSDTNGAPDALVVDAGTVSSATTGGKSITINQALTAGWYWLALVSNGTPTVRAINVGSSSYTMLGFTSATDTTTHGAWSVAFTYASLPNPFTGGGALTTSTPRIILGV
jgi:hypothetical protein